MRGLRNTSIVILLVILGVLVAATAATSSTRSSSGSWRLLPAAPVSFPQSQSGIWTGRRLILIGRTPLRNPSKDVAAAYNPTTNRWTRLTPRRSPDYVPGYRTVWTGKQMLTFDPFHSVAYTPATNRWRVSAEGDQPRLRHLDGTRGDRLGRRLLRRRQRNGSAYNPATGGYRKLPPSPLGASQHALGAWTGAS